MSRRAISAVRFPPDSDHPSSAGSVQQRERGRVTAAPLPVLLAPAAKILLALFPELWFDALRAFQPGYCSRFLSSTSVRQQRPPPNNAMELTASRRTIQLHMSSISQLAATRALARGSSSCSR